jgi:hypothetical protein
MFTIFQIYCRNESHWFLNRINLEYKLLRFAPMRGIYFLKKTCDNIFFFQYKNKNSYLQDRRRLVSISWTLSRIYFFRFQWWFTFAFLALLPLQLLSPAAPAAGSAASGPAPAAAPSWGRSGLPLWASLLLLTATPPVLLTSRVRVAALRARQLPWQP